MHRCLWKKHKRMVVGAMAHEVAQAGADLSLQGFRQTGTKIQLIRNFKTEQSTIKIHGPGDRFDIDTKVP